MILCKKCGFGVLETMRYALKSNACPSCGQTLFGDSHTQEMTAISGRIRSQAFSQSLSEDIVFDISLFILNNYSDFNEEVAVSSAKPPEEDRLEIEEDDDSIESIRDQVREEVIASLPGDDVDIFDEESEDMRLSRLKRMAKMSNDLKKSGPSVRRVTT
jgi:predicted  nucleic acid-binding Zn-ribbon protein